MEDITLAYKKLFGLIKEELTDDDIERASCELNETEDGKPVKLKELRACIVQNAENEFGDKVLSTFGHRNDATLLRFLRARKFNVSTAYDLMKGYIKFREKYPEISENLTAKNVRMSLENGYPGLLPFRDKEGHVVLLFSIGTWDAKEYSFDVVLQGYMLLLERLLENESAQINGFVIVENFHHYSMAQAFSLRPHDLKKMVDMLQGAFPARFKGVHFIYQPWYFTWTYAIVKPFLKKKLADRVHVHGFNLEKFYTLFDRNLLPKEFGGLGATYNPTRMTEILFEAVKESETSDSKTAGSLASGDQELD